MPLADTLLRMAETPRLYLPLWSSAIFKEVSRNLIAKFGKSAEQAGRRESAITAAFPESMVEGYSTLIPKMPNHAKDRHVAAAAVHGKAAAILTLNQKDFPSSQFSSLGISIFNPSEFLASLYAEQPEIVEKKLLEQARSIGIELAALLSVLRIHAPALVEICLRSRKSNPKL